MVAKLVISHGPLAEELLETARRIAGPMESFEALCVPWDAERSTVVELIEEAVERVDSGDGVLILADMFGDTPCRAALPLTDSDRVELLSGVNLPLLVKLGCTGGHELGLTELARAAREKGRASICLASDVKPAVTESEPTSSVPEVVRS